MKLYRFPPSPNTRKVQAVAVHLGEHPGMVRADRGVTRMARDSAEDVMHYRYPLREKRRVHHSSEAEPYQPRRLRAKVWRECRSRASFLSIAHCNYRFAGAARRNLTNIGGFTCI